MPANDLFAILYTGQNSGLLPAAPPAAPSPAPMTSQTGNAIPYWGFYGGQNYFDTDPMASSAGQQFLAGLQKFDPNARFNQTTMGESGSPVWTLQYDARKLPGGRIDGTGKYVDLNPGDFNPQYDPMGTDPGASHSFQAPLFNPNAVGNVSTYGRVTSPRNVNYAAADRSWLDIVGPALVGILGMAFGGSLPFLQQLLLKAPNTIGNIINNQQRGG